MKCLVYLTDGIPIFFSSQKTVMDNNCTFPFSFFFFASSGF